MERYFGTYQTFQTVSRKEAAALVGADNLIGDRYTIDCTLEDGQQRAWLVNRFGARIGFFDPAFSRELSLKKAQGMTLAGLLSLVAYSEQPEPGGYWGEAAVIAFDPRESEAFDVFIGAMGTMLGKGIRPQIALNDREAEKIVSSGGSWVPTERVPLPKEQKGMAILKQRRSFTDGLIEQGRQGNKGCYFLSWAVLLGLVALVIVGLKSCGVF